MAQKAYFPALNESVPRCASPIASDCEADHAEVEQERFERRKALIQQTWRAVEFGLDVEATRLFYDKLFRQYPSVIPMFASADMEAQATKLFEVVRVAVRLLDNVEQLVPILQDMGVRHARSYGVERAHYGAVTEVFVEVFNEYIRGTMPTQLACGSMARWSLEVAEAWQWVLTLIGKTMADAADAAIATRMASRPPVGVALESRNESLSASFH